MIVSLNEKSYNYNYIPISCQNLVTKIDEILDIINADINQFKLDNNARQEKLDKLSEQIELLKEHKSIYE